MRRGELGVVGAAELPRAARRARTAEPGSSGELALDHAQRVGRDAGVERHPALGGRPSRRPRGTRAPPRPARPRSGGRAGRPVHRATERQRRRRAGSPGSSPSRSYSFSQTRRPMAASSTEREPLRWLDACMMQITPHLSVPSTSHQRSDLGIDGRPGGRLVGGDQLVVVADARRPAAASRSARPARRTSRGPPAGRRGGPAPSRARPEAVVVRRAGCRAGSRRARRGGVDGGRLLLEPPEPELEAGCGSPSMSSSAAVLRDLVGCLEVRRGVDGGIAWIAASAAPTGATSSDGRRRTRRRGGSSGRSSRPRPAHDEERRAERASVVGGDEPGAPAHRSGRGLTQQGGLGRHAAAGAHRSPRPLTLQDQRLAIGRRRTTGRTPTSPATRRPTAATTLVRSRSAPSNTSTARRVAITDVGDGHRPPLDHDSVRRSDSSRMSPTSSSSRSSSVTSPTVRPLVVDHEGDVRSATAASRRSRSSRAASTGTTSMRRMQRAAARPVARPRRAR